MDVRRKLLSFFILAAVLISLAYSFTSAPNARRHFRFTQPAMGTIFHIDCYGVEETAAAGASKKAFLALHEIEAALSRFRDDSEISSVNKNPATPHKMSAHLSECMDASIEAAKISDGYFDITFMPLYKLWDWRNMPSKLPERDSVEAALAKVGYSKIKIDRSSMTVSLANSMMIDLGGLAKGYAVGKMAGIMTGLGISDCIVEGGGDLYVTAKRPYVIGIKDPFGGDEKMSGRLIVEGPVSVFTSGDYEQFTVIDGKNYGHIIDPKTGYPAEGLKSATIIGSSPALTDGLATALIAMGLKKAIDFSARKKLATVLIGCDGKFHFSPEFEKTARFIAQ